MRTIKVVDYQKNWPELFTQECSKLLDKLAQLKPTIHHIGSTAVVGLAARPIIDILMEVDDVSSLDRLEDMIDELGYFSQREQGVQGRRDFQKDGKLLSYHIHAFDRGSNNTLRHLALRDYLIDNLDIADQYSEIKRRAAQSCNNDIDLYCEAKDGFLKQQEKLAIQWLEQRPGIPNNPITLKGNSYSFFDKLVFVHTLPKFLEPHLSDPDSDYHTYAFHYQLLVETPLLQRVWQIDEYGNYWLEINTLDTDNDLSTGVLRIETATFTLLENESYLVLDERI